MSQIAPDSLADALRETLKLQALGEPTGNLSVSKAEFEGRTVLAALVENRMASGSIGKREVLKLKPLLKIAGAERTPVVLFLDCAGARVSEGLVALGAFRFLFRAAIAAAADGAPIAALLGRNCYGGASMLAHVASRRLFSPGTQLAMSGPSILAQSAGANALDEAFRAMAEAAINAAARAKASDANQIWSPSTDLAAWLRGALVPVERPWSEFHRRHARLRERLAKGVSDRVPEPLRRRDLEKLYAEGYEAKESDGLVTGKARRSGIDFPVLGLVGKSLLGAERAWRFADAAWEFARRAPPRIEVLLDCESHAPRLEDERIVLTEFIVDMGLALAALAARGTKIDLIILGRAGGGVYVALAGAATSIAAVYGADIQVLPGTALASILGDSGEAVAGIDEYRRADVADTEIKLGLVP